MPNTVNLLKQLEQLRKSLIIAMVYSDYGEMSDDDLDILHGVLLETLRKRKIENKVERIELLLHSHGGDANPAYRIANMIRLYCKEFRVIIPRKAKSAATLLTLGADKIYLSKTAELGPIDPLVSHPLMTGTLIPAMAVKAFIEEILPELMEKYGHEAAEYFLRVDYAHVGFCRQSTEVAKEYASRLLKKFHFKDDSESKIEEVVESLVSYPSHDFVIDYDEAKKIGLNVELLDSRSEPLILKLYENYKGQLNDSVLIVESTESRREIKRPKKTIW